MKIKMQKVLGIAMAGALVAGTLSGCSGGGDSGEKVNFSIYQFKVEAKDAFQKAIDTYQKEHKNVSITLETVGGGADYATEIKARMESNQPAIFNVGGPQNLNDWKEKTEDLSDQPWVEHAKKGTLDGATVDGKVYGLPFDLEGYGFVINREIFEDAGISFDSMLTFDGMKEGFYKLQEKIDAGEMKEKYPNLEAVMEYPAKELWIVGEHAVNPILAQEFESSFDAFNSQNLEFKAVDAHKKIIDFQVGYTKNKDNKEALNSVDYSTSLEGGIALERVAAIQQGSWIIPTMKATDEDVLKKLDMLPYSLPGYEEGKYCAGVPQYWAVNKDVPQAQRESAKDFLNWMYQSEEGKKIMVQDAGIATPFDNYDDSLFEDEYPLMKRVSQAYNSGSTMPGWIYQGAPATWAQKVAGAQVQKYLSGSTPWSSVVETCKKEWTDLRK